MKRFIRRAVSDNLQCYACGKKDVQFYKCGAECGMDIHCSKACQTAMWHGIHKYMCVVGGSVKREREDKGDGDDKEPSLTKKQKTQLALFEKLLTTFADVRYTILMTMAEATNITRSDIIVLQRVSKVIRDSIKKTPEFWYMVWKYKFPESFAEGFSPDFDPDDAKDGYYRDMVYEALYPYTFQVAATNHDLTFTGTEVTYNIELPKNQVKQMLEEYLYGDNDRLIDVMKQSIDGVFNIKARTYTPHPVDDNYLHYALEVPMSEDQFEFILLVTYIAPTIQILGKKGKDLFFRSVLPRAMYTSDPNDPNYAKNVVDEKLTQTLGMVRRMYDNNSFPTDVPFEIRYFTPELGDPGRVLTLGNNTIKSADDIQKIIRGIYSRIPDLVQEFMESDFVHDEAKQPISPMSGNEPFEGVFHMNIVLQYASSIETHV